MQTTDKDLVREIAKLAICEAGAVALFSRLEVNREWAMEKAKDFSLFSEDDIRLSFEVVFDSNDARESELYFHVMRTIDSGGFQAARNELPEEYQANLQFSLSCLVDMRYKLDMWAGQLNSESLAEVRSMRKQFDVHADVVRGRLQRMLDESGKTISDVASDFVPEEEYMEEVYTEIEAEMGMLAYELTYDTIERGYTAAKAYLEILDEESQGQI